MIRRILRFWFILAGLAVAPTSAEACGWSGYSYAGVVSQRVGFGVSATVSAPARPGVVNGHVAAWVGVGGQGRREWLQVGLSADEDGEQLYYEVGHRGRPAVVVTLDSQISRGERHRLAVVELPKRPNWWRVYVDRRPTGSRVYLPRSHGAWKPLATAESWTDGEPVCNTFRYRFDNMRVLHRPGGKWRPLPRGTVLEDPGYRVIHRRPTSFVATVAAAPEPAPREGGR